MIIQFKLQIFEEDYEFGVFFYFLFLIELGNNPPMLIMYFLSDSALIQEHATTISVYCDESS